MTVAGTNSVVSVVAAVNAALDVTAIPAAQQFIGDQHLKRNDAPPRLVWVLGKERFEAPDGNTSKSGPGPWGPAGHPAVPVGRPLFTRVCGFELHLWGANEGLTEELLTEVVRALYKVAHGCLGALRGGWPPLEGGAYTILGREYLLTGEFRIPLQARPPAGAVISSQQRVLTAELPAGPLVVVDEVEPTP
jgi:hypothetical protein